MAVAVARPFSSGNGKPVDLEATLRSVARVIQQVLPPAVSADWWRFATARSSSLFLASPTQREAS